MDKKFMLLLTKCGGENIELFLGVARILKVKLVDESKKEPRDFTDVFQDIMDSFHKSTKTRRRELYDILKQALKSKPSEVANASSTKD